MEKKTYHKAPCYARKALNFRESDEDNVESDKTLKSGYIYSQKTAKHQQTTSHQKECALKE